MHVMMIGVNLQIRLTTKVSQSSKPLSAAAEQVLTEHLRQCHIRWPAGVAAAAPTRGGHPVCRTTYICNKCNKCAGKFAGNRSNTDAAECFCRVTR
jgi:hypothetical protein